MSKVKKYQILIAEDSHTQALVLSKNLQEQGIQTATVSDGQAALEELEKQPFDLLITDVTMPKMSGFELCKKLRENPKTAQLPVMILTALYDPQDVIKAIESGADFFLTKPSRPELIQGFIEDFFQNRQEKQEHHSVRFVLNGAPHTLDIDINRVMTLLFSTYQNAVEKNRVLEKTQQQLRERNTELKLLNHLKNTFLGMAAHDLRNPLTVVKGYCELLLSELKDKIDANLFQMLEHILAATEHIRVMVNELLDVSVIEAGKLQLDLKKHDLAEALTKTVQLNQMIAGKKEIEIKLIQEKLPQVVCDVKKIDEVLTNFLTNAIKYSNPKTVVTVRLYREGEHFCFSVQDAGQGIPKADQDKLFRTFSKAAVKTTAGESSTGLGLAIVKKIVEAHGGEIGFSSEEGKGSTFFAKIPIEGVACSNQQKQ